MRRLLFVSFSSILFIIFSCKKVDENSTYKIDLKSSQIFYKKEYEVWRDTIFYSIIGATEENYRFVLLESDQNYESFEENYYSKDQYVKIVQQTSNYLIYEVNPSSSLESNRSVSLFLIVNGEVIDNVVIPTKYIKNDNQNNDEDWLIYTNESSYIKQYDFLTEEKNHFYISSNLLMLKLSPTGTDYAYVVNRGLGSDIYHRSITGEYIGSQDLLAIDDIGFYKTGELFYRNDDYIYKYIIMTENTTHISSLYILDLVDFVSASNCYFSINYTSNKYYIQKDKSSILYSTDNKLRDIAIDDQEEKIVFVENGNTLMLLDLETNIVSTLYTTSFGLIREPDFKGDGTKIAFVLEDNSEKNIKAIDINNGTVMYVTNGDFFADYNFPNWK